jgi:hypothetical protein
VGITAPRCPFLMLAGGHPVDADRRDRADHRRHLGAGILPQW